MVLSKIGHLDITELGNMRYSSKETNKEKKGEKEMASLTIEYLSNTFERAKELDYRFVGILIEKDGFEMPEVIINQVENFDSILAYYEKTYNENLNHKYAEGKRISAFTFGNSFSEIQEYLLG
ncbi:hypothetical protein [Desulfosporosinus sp. BICA1-9]|uniref:hypothetical protein n=1 Tax=Desulfosporosinus sp. BICA1-9 TaxID=1531958 RepID=UPI000AECEE3A|nr:hypothetical protein [Desulfosporosinus sp. BICA1-9]